MRSVYVDDSYKQQSLDYTNKDNKLLNLTQVNSGSNLICLPQTGIFKAFQDPGHFPTLLENDAIKVGDF